MDRPPDARRPGPGWQYECWGDPEAALEELGVTPGTSLADLGCGEGFFALPAAALVAPAPVYAVDADGTCLDELDAMAVERGVGNLTTVSGDPRDVSSFLPELVDVALAAGTLNVVEAPTAFAEQVSRSLRPGGRFLVVDWRDPPPAQTTAGGAPPRARRLSPGETRDAVALAGFTASREVDLPPHGYAVEFRRRHDA